MALITQGAIDRIRDEFTKDIQAEIAKRERSTRTDKERLFGEMMIYEDSLRIMRRVLARVYSNPY